MRRRVLSRSSPGLSDMKRERTIFPCSALFALALIMGLGEIAEGQRMDYGNRLGRRVGEQVRYSAVGPAVDMDVLDPTVMRWYMPQELFSEYGRRQWNYTNYAREPYRRYLSRNLDGNYFYDAYGDFITRGYVVYDWRQTQPRAFGSSAITKTGRYANWFNRLVISSDQTSDYSYSIIVGDEIRTILTPMTFNKVGFNGVVTSFATSRTRATGLFSRVTLPVVDIDSDVPTASLENFTNLAAGRFEVDVTDQATLGLTLVNAHNGSGARESFQGSPLKGQLTSGQLDRQLNMLVVRLSDDSPGDGEGGAVLFSDDLEITTTLLREIAVGDSMQLVARDTTIVGSGIGFRSVRDGGELRDGFLRADGAESITLKYVLAPEGDASEEGSLRLILQQQLGLSLAEAADAVTAIKNVRFRLVLANDYRVEVTSDRQANRSGQPQFIVMERAPGNIKNELNQREVVIDYGLPTASQIFGLSAEFRDFHGFDFYGEFNISNQYRQYPSITRKKHQSFSGIVGDETAVGWMFNLARKSGPWSLFLEGFGMDETYATSVLPVDGRGGADYSPEATNLLYDFVDDNDDHDRHPDQLRIFQGSLIPPQTTSISNFTVTSEGVADPAVFPGYDENGDFISDFNQNGNGDTENLFPDYEEPFLRYHSDRPEFLFGIDLNNNGWAERFENDDLPDYPYKKDHWGYNAYARIQINPETRLTGGILYQDQRETDRRNETAYGIFTFRQSWPARGTLQIYDMLKRAEDTIPDPLSQWLLSELEFGTILEQTSGRNTAVPDLLAAEDTWINTFYADWAYQSPRRWATRHRFKWDWWRQRNVDKVFALDDAGERVLDMEGEPVVVFDPLGPAGRNGRATSGFIGLINKIDYAYDWRRLWVSPRFKSEFLREVPFNLDLVEQRSWDAIWSLLVRFPLLVRSSVDIGFERRQFYNLKDDEGGLAAGMRTGDFSGTVLAVQLTNRKDYLGYELIAQLGLRYDRRSLEIVDGDTETRTAGLAFLSVFASLR